MSKLTQQQMDEIGTEMMEIVKDLVCNGAGGLVYTLTAIESFGHTINELTLEELQEKMPQFPPDDLANWKNVIVPPLLERIHAFKLDTATKLQMQEVMQMFENFKRNDAPLH